MRAFDCEFETVSKLFEVPFRGLGTFRRETVGDDEQMIQIVRAFLACMAILFSPHSALALEAQIIIVMQSVLNDHGFNVGEPDGKIGSATRTGLEEFGKLYGTPSDPQNIFQFMVSQNHQSSVVIDNESKLTIIKNSVSEGLRDPSSANFRNIKEVTHFDRQFVCGEVNGKNIYGAYVGFQWFRGILINDYFLLIGIDNPNENDLNNLFCAMSFPKK